MPKKPRSDHRGKEWVAMAFYVPATYHTLYGRFFRDPSDVTELDREYSNYLWQRLFAFSNFNTKINVKNVRVDPAEFFAYLADKGVDWELLGEKEVSAEIALFAMTLESPTSPIVETVQPLPAPLPPGPLRGLLATLTPLPEVRREDVPAESVVGATLVVDAEEKGTIGRYLVWVDGNFPLSACIRALEAQCASIPAMLTTRASRPEPLHLCACCKLPTLVCPNEPREIG